MNSDRTFGGAMPDYPPAAEVMSALLAESWWLIALRGVVAIIFGLIALFVPVAVLLSLALLFGAYALVGGVIGLVAAIRAARTHQRWGLLFTEGILNIVMGIVAILFPASAILAFVIVTAVWALLSGGMLLGTAFQIHQGRWWLVLSGVVSVVWGILLLLAPLVGAIVLTWWLGAYAIVFGVTLLVLAYKLRVHHASNRGMFGGPAHQGTGL
jgi:uncharacterized membrane protein HdeD (DUF308 family)